MKNLLSLESLTGEQIAGIVDLGIQLKADRFGSKPLADQVWAMIFSKSSTRTRVSFEVGIRELGGSVMMLSQRDMQLGRGEPIKDTARVLGRMVGGAIIRTYDQKDVDDFAEYSNVPTINALTDEEHPCQVLADLMTMRELQGGWSDKKVVYLGDGDNNMARSWIWASERLGFEFVVAAPEGHQPSADYLAELQNGTVSVTQDARAACENADVLYTDVWVSMGQEDEAEEKVKKFGGYQINKNLVSLANKDALVMHCLPAYRGLEIDAETLEAHANTIFQEAENRLHAQKAVLVKVAGGG